MQSEVSKSRRIVLVQPMYSKQELNADSNYVIYTAWIRALSKMYPRWQFVVVFPDSKSGFKYEDDGFFKLSCVTRLPQRISPRKLANCVTFDGTWYDRLFRMAGFDAIWCNLVEIAAQLKHSGQGIYEESARPLMIAAHNYVIHKTLPYPIHSLMHVLWAQLMGAYNADVNVFNSCHCREMLMDNAKQFLSPQACSEILNRSMLINYGCLEPELEPVDPRNEVPIIAYNHRLQGYKQWRITFQVLQELHDEGVRFKVRYMNNAAENITQIKKYPFVQARLCANRDEYLKQLRGCDLNVSNSVHETFCISAIESMALGQPIVAPDGITFPEITGKAKTGYPYLFSNVDDQKRMLRVLLTDHAKRRMWGLRLSEHVRSHFGWDLWAARYGSLIETRTDPSYGTPDDALDFFKETLSKSDGLPVRDFFNRVQGKPVNGRTPFGNQSLPFTKLIRLVRNVGGDVRMVRGEQKVFS